MKILLFGDVHCNISSLRSLSSTEDAQTADIIAIDGDIECDGEILEIIKAMGKPVYFVPGNMDDVALAKIFMEAGFNIDGELREIGDKWIIGGIGGLSLYSSINVLKEKLKAKPMRGKKLIILSHHPPRSKVTDLAFKVIHTGIEELNSVIEEYRPVLFMHGHIHEAMGHELIDDTLVVNPGPLYKGYYAIVYPGEKKVMHKRLKKEL